MASHIPSPPPDPQRSWVPDATGSKSPTAGVSRHPSVPWSHTVHPGEPAPSHLRVPPQGICFTSMISLWTLVRLSSWDCGTLSFMSSQMTIITANEAGASRRPFDFKLTQSLRHVAQPPPLPATTTFPTLLLKVIRTNTTFQHYCFF